jgi:triacylglycerol lipase
MTARVVLIPGFFGFANFGDLHYFHLVGEAIERGLAPRGVRATIHVIDALPAATVARRSAYVREQLVALAGANDGPMHLVGHSTGALDARFIVTPARERSEDGAVVRRVASVVSVCGAHRGTPLATAFRTALGKRLLRTLGLMTVQSLRIAPLSLAGALAFTSSVSLVDAVLGAKADLLDQIHHGILVGFTPERRVVLEKFFQALAEDQGLLDELTPMLAQHFDAQTPNHEGVRYGCVLACARRPTWLAPTHAVSSLSPYAQGSQAVFRALHALSARSDAQTSMNQLHAHQHSIRARLGHLPSLADSDGVVPVHAQLHGHLIDVVEADHHDVLGHFHDPPNGSDWLWSYSRFDRARFVQLWDNVAAFLAHPAQHERR